MLPVPRATSLGPKPGAVQECTLRPFQCPPRSMRPVSLILVGVEEGMRAISASQEVSAAKGRAFARTVTPVF